VEETQLLTVKAHCDRGMIQFVELIAAVAPEFAFGKVKPIKRLFTNKQKREFLFFFEITVVLEASGHILRTIRENHRQYRLLLLPILKTTYHSIGFPQHKT
jgi:hypothetical protein